MEHVQFVHLHSHSEYSLLDGGCRITDEKGKPSEWMQTIARMKMPALALTDHGNLYGAIEFYQAATAVGVKPIIGCEMYLAPGSRSDRTARNGQEDAFFHFTVLARNEQGYRNLIKLSSLAFLEGYYYKPRVDKDLLQKYGEKPPETWEQLAATARKIQDGERRAGNAKMWGYVWQGKSSEGLTCNALEWIVSYGGGTIVDAAGKVTVKNDAAIAALNMARSWIGTISPKGVLSYGEEEARGVFQSGNAVFMRNWPYAWATANSADSPIKGKIGAMPLPKGGSNGRHAATLGGQQLAVSKFSSNTDAAIDLVLYLTGEAEQKRRALVGSYNPTIRSLYSDRDIFVANPFQGRLYNTFANATARPSAVTRARYNQVSSEFWNTVFTVIGEGNDPAESLQRLDAKLRRISAHGTWQ